MLAQVYKPELGPLDQRVTLSWLDGILEGEINLEDTEYWFTEPPGPHTLCVMTVRSLKRLSCAWSTFARHGKQCVCRWLITMQSQEGLDPSGFAWWAHSYSHIGAVYSVLFMVLFKVLFGALLGRGLCWE